MDVDGCNGSGDVRVLIALLVQKSGATNSALMAGTMRTDGIELHIDSGASRPFISDVRLFASWENEAPNITFSTAAAVPITSRDIGTLKFLTTDVNCDVRVVTLEHVYYLPNQAHNLISVRQLTKQCTEK